MPRQEHILTVFVASPCDLSAERARLEEETTELNQSWSRSLGMRLDLIRWETHIYPEFGEDPQEVINRQIPDDYDIFIGIMWHRFGTPTGRAESGTLEEFLRAKARWDNDKSSVCLMIYFKDSPISPSQVDASQLGKVMEFRKSLGNEGGLYWSFQSTEEFVNLVRMHLSRVVQEWHGRLPPVEKKQRIEQVLTKPQYEKQAELPDEMEVGIFELTEQLEDSFAEATDVLARIAKSTEAIGKKMQDHTSRVEAANAAGEVSRPAAKRMISKVAKDMNDYAGKLEQDVPTLGNLMKTGLDALSQAISLWPDISRDRAQREVVVGSIVAMQGLRNVLSTVQSQIKDFRHAVTSLPRLTSDLNRAKRSVSTALQKVIDLLQTQQQILTQTEKAATDLVKTVEGTAESLNGLESQ
jgi:uncharacterized membrane-anchored protein YhcB (DUF1043 family)